ncbi:MAG: trypsin-like peptidase domain-containing protein, partial [Azonexus sp.]
MKRILALLSFLLISSIAVAQTRGLPDFTELAERQGPAVVNISTTQVTRSNQTTPFPFDENDPAFEFFKRFIPRNPGGATPREFENKSLGSGFVISGDGYILTNAHVVDGADEVTVRLTDKREFKAKTIGADKRTDIALLKIEASGLPV